METYLRLVHCTFKCIKSKVGHANTPPHCLVPVLESWGILPGRRSRKILMDENMYWTSLSLLMRDNTVIGHWSPLFRMLN